jgi:predicted PurR-regulated permease PerM
MDSREFQRAVSWGFAALLLYFLYQIVEFFLVPLTWAAVLAIFCYPIHRRILAWIRRPNVAAFVSVFALTVVLVAPITLLVPAFVREAIDIVGGAPAQNVLPTLKRFLFERLDQLPVSVGELETILSELGQKARVVLAEQSARFAGNLALFIFDLVVTLMGAFYLFRDGPGLVELVRDISPLGGEHRDRMMEEAAALISVTLSSGFVVAAVQGILGGLLFAILGLRAPIFWGVCVAVLAFLPVLGPWLVWAPAAVGLMIGGEVGRGVTMLILGFVLVSGADNVLRPALVAGRSQLNGMLVFIALLGGIGAFGFLGLVLGPLIVALAVGLLRGYRESLLEHDTGPRPPVPAQSESATPVPAPH